MFIGHYGVSLAAKRYNPRLSLAALFLAVQFLDVVFSVLVFAGVEKMRIIHGFTAFNPYDLYFMPYSHSLLGALAWSVVFAIGFLAVARRDSMARRLAAAAVLAAAVFSHCLLDIPMHTRDLPLGRAPARRRSAWDSGTIPSPRSPRSSPSSLPAASCTSVPRGRAAGAPPWPPSPSASCLSR
jgi:membrane-bound metal-dependent hydrolase YbcI (DUF457 family)